MELRNILKILEQLAILGFMVIGMTYVMAAGGIDLSTYTVVSAAAVVGATLMVAGYPPLVGCAVMIWSGPDSAWSTDSRLPSAGGAKLEIGELVKERAYRGMSALLISSEIEEIVSLSDRVLILKEGRLVGDVSGDEINNAILMRYGLGEEPIGA